MGYDINLVGKDSETSGWYSSMWEMAGFRSAMAELGMLVPPTETPDDFDDGYDVDIGAPGIPAFKLKFTTFHSLSAREIGAALATLDATPDALTIARPLLLEPNSEPGGGPLDVITQVAANFGVDHGPGAADSAPRLGRWLAWIAYLREAAANEGIDVC